MQKLNVKNKRADELQKQKCSFLHFSHLTQLIINGSLFVFTNVNNEFAFQNKYKELNYITLVAIINNKEMDETKWKDIPINELNNYQAHPSGLVRNIVTKKIRSVNKKDNEYIYYTFGKFTTSLHRIIAFTFIENDDPQKKTQVDHINEDKKDNCVENLRWITPSDNVQKAVDKGRKDGKPGTTPITVTFPDNTTKIYNSQVDVISELSLKNINIIKYSINLRAGFYYGSDKTNKKNNKWIYKFEYADLITPCGSVIEQDITIEGFTHLIACSNGIIKNKKNKKIITGSFDGNYYRIKPQCKNKKIIIPSTFAHRLLALTFIPNPDNKQVVNHKNGNKKDNSISNLEWATQKENVQHAIDSGLINHIIITGDKIPSIHNEPRTIYHTSSPVLQLNFDGKIIKNFDRIEQVEEIFGKGKASICRNYRKKIYSFSCGYNWCYEKDYDSDITFHEKILEIFPDITDFENLNYEHIRKYIVKEARPVWQLDLDGTKVNCFDSIKDAAESLNVTICSIHNSISKNNLFIKGYKFKYMSYYESVEPNNFIYIKEIIDYVITTLDIPDNIKIKSEICKILHENVNTNGELKLTVPIVQLNDDGTFKRIWSGQRVIERELGLPRNTIYRYLHDDNNKNWRKITIDEMCNL